MEKQKPIITTESMMSYASSTMLKFAGSLLVLSFAINNIKQLDKIADAYAEVIVITAKANTKSCPIPTPTIIKQIDLSPIENRLSIVESMAHEQKVKL